MESLRDDLKKYLFQSVRSTPQLFTFSLFTCCDAAIDFIQLVCYDVAENRESRGFPMETTILQYLIICPLVGLAAFVDAVAGGGGLISLPAYLIAGLPVHYAIGTNKLSACMGATVSAGKYAKAGFIPWRTAIPCVIAAMFGSSLGAKLALLVSDYYFKRLILVILPLTAVYILKDKSMSADKEPLPFWLECGIGSLVSFVIGIYDGFYGPGTGVFLILLLTGLAHFNLKQANGLSKAVNWMTNVSALAVYLLNGKVMIGIGLAAGMFSLVGGYLGARTFEKKGAQTVRPLMLIVLTIFFVKILTEILAA